ncbi:MAG: DNA/RNA nuclease SfsA [Candidatus Marinimicrobia bacterium]|nr:DNA/RNA nuclease SfsA [Candidatus Neomarinimicrobiota bacterium]
MKTDGYLTDATFVRRPNRFLTIVRINGREEESHLPDPGRLEELLIPGVRLKVRQVANEKRENRKTDWTTVLVRKGEEWVSIDSTLPNRFVRSLLENRQLSIFKNYQLVQSEVKLGNHRFDFLLQKNGTPLYLEVKSVTLVEDGVAMFPDAVTERGRRHMNALAGLSRSGAGAAVLFVCQRSDVRCFQPQWDRDQKFAQALLEAERAGVRISVITAAVSPAAIEFKNTVPYDLMPF